MALGQVRERERNRYLSKTRDLFGDERGSLQRPVLVSRVKEVLLIGHDQFASWVDKTQAVEVLLFFSNFLDLRVPNHHKRLQPQGCQQSNKRVSALSNSY